MSSGEHNQLLMLTASALVIQPESCPQSPDVSPAPDLSPVPYMSPAPVLSRLWFDDCPETLPPSWDRLLVCVLQLWAICSYTEQLLSATVDLQSQSHYLDTLRVPNRYVLESHVFCGHV